MRPSATVPSGHQSSLLQGRPLCGLHGSFCCGRLTSAGHLLGMLVPRRGGCQALPCVEAAGPCLAESGQEAAGCSVPGGPRASAAPLIGRAKFWGGQSGARLARSSVSLLGSVDGS